MKSLEKILTQNSFKLTKPRLTILKYLSNSKKILSARQLHKKIGEYNQASIYRTLKLFESLKIVKTEVIKKEKFYCAGKEPHHHIICRICGHTENLPYEEKEYHHKNFIDIQSQLKLDGICKKCSQKIKL